MPKPEHQNLIGETYTKLYVVGAWRGIEEERDWVKNEEDTLNLLGVKVRNTHAVVLSFGNKVQH